MNIRLSSESFAFAYDNFRLPDFTKLSNTPVFKACGLMLFGFGFCFGLLCGWLAGGYMDCVFDPRPYIGKPLKARPKKRNV